MTASRMVLASLVLALAATPALASDNSKSHLNAKELLAFDGGGGVGISTGIGSGANPAGGTGFDGGGGVSISTGTGGASPAGGTGADGGGGAGISTGTGNGASPAGGTATQDGEGGSGGSI
jgi:hypothetical protein